MATDVWLNPLVGASGSFLGYRDDGEEFPHDIYSFLLSTIRKVDRDETLLVWRWLQGHQLIWESIYGKILSLPLLYSPEHCPENCVDYLRMNVGITSELDYIWGLLDTTDKRKFIKFFVRFAQYKATQIGIEELLEFMLGINVDFRFFFFFRWILSGEDEIVELETALGCENSSSDSWLISEVFVPMGINPDSVYIVADGSDNYYEFIIDTLIARTEAAEPPIPLNARIIYRPSKESELAVIYQDGGNWKVRGSANNFFGQKSAPYNTTIRNFQIGFDADPYVYDIRIVDDGGFDKELVTELVRFSRSLSERIYIRYYWMIDDFVDFTKWSEISGTATYDEDDKTVTLFDAVDPSVIRVVNTDALEWAEYSLSVKAYNSDVEKYFEIRFAWQDSDNYLYLRLTPATPPEIPVGTGVLRQVVGGVDTPLDIGEGAPETVAFKHFDIDVNYFWRIVWVISEGDILIQMFQDENIFHIGRYVNPWDTIQGSVELVSEDGGTVVVSYVDVHPFPMESVYIGP